MPSEVQGISFVIIGKNEQYALRKCLYSLLSFSFNSCEFILVDSGSTDGTLAVMKEYSNLLPQVKVFHLKGESNSAVARNVGIREAQCKYIFFLDGDIAPNIDFLIPAVKKLENGECQGVVGGLYEVHYTPDFSRVIRELHVRDYFAKQEAVYCCGGSFIADSAAVRQVGLFDEAFFRSQDVEFTLRFSKKYCLMSLKEVMMGTHHTVPYDNLQRALGFISKGSYRFFGEIIKRNLFNTKGLSYLFRKMLSGIITGLFLCILFFVSLLLNPLSGAFIIFFILTLDILFGWKQKKGALYRLLLHYVAPWCIILGFFYYPKRKLSYQLERVS